MNDKLMQLHIEKKNYKRLASELLFNLRYKNNKLEHNKMNIAIIEGYIFDLIFNTKLNQANKINELIQYERRKH